jgi:hypothetical protein
VLERLEGHYIRGYGDSQRPDAPIELLAGAVDAAEGYLAGDSESRHRLARVTRLIEGFETPYGMELLATVHWVAVSGGHDGSPPAGDAEAAIRMVHAWNPRKQQIFKPHHIRTAWNRLAEQGWIGTAPDSPGDEARLL